MQQPTLTLKRRRTAGSLSDALLIQWRALKAAEQALYAAGEMNDVGGVLRCVHAITQAATGFAKLSEAGDLAARVEALEQHIRMNGRYSYAQKPHSTN